MDRDRAAALPAVLRLHRALGNPQRLARFVAVVGGIVLGCWIVGATFGELVLSRPACGAAPGRCPGSAADTALFYGTVALFTGLLTRGLLRWWARRDPPTALRLLGGGGAGFVCGLASSTVYWTVAGAMRGEPGGAPVAGVLFGLVLAGPFGAALGLVHALLYGVVHELGERVRGHLTPERLLAGGAAWLLLLSVGPTLLRPQSMPWLLPAASLSLAALLAGLGWLVRGATVLWLRRVAAGRVPGWSLGAALDGPATSRLPRFGVPPVVPRPSAVRTLFQTMGTPDDAPFRTTARPHPVALVPERPAFGTGDALLAALTAGVLLATAIAVI